MTGPRSVDVVITAALDIMTDARCLVTELIESQCDHCRPPAPVDAETAALRARLYSRRGWFPARHAGTCCSCAFPFPPASAVHQAPGDPEALIAECCAEVV
jgi:hypothetical protein